MELAMFSAFGGKQRYQKIECAKVQDMDGLDGEFRSEAETAGLLAENVKMGGEEEMSKAKHFHRQAFAWKPSPLRANDKIQLVIHKLDNTSFALQVANRATVLDLKKALQERFDKSGYQVSWPHVWGNFCLSFKNQKLLDDTVPLGILGIGNDDELFFVRHLATSRQPHHIRGAFFKIVRRSLSSS